MKRAKIIHYIPVCITIQASGNYISSKGESFKLFNGWFSGLCWWWQVSDQVSFWGRFIPERIGQRNPIKMESVRSKISLDWIWGFRPTPSPSICQPCQITCRSHIFLTRHPDKPSILCVLPSNLFMSNAHQPATEAQTPHSTATCMSYPFQMFIIMCKPDNVIGWEEWWSEWNDFRVGGGNMCLMRFKHCHKLVSIYFWWIHVATSLLLCVLSESRVYFKAEAFWENLFG